MAEKTSGEKAVWEVAIVSGPDGFEKARVVTVYAESKEIAAAWACQEAAILPSDVIALVVRPFRS